MILRKANRNEAAICYQCIEDARVYHSSLGFVQWHPGYPTLHTIEQESVLFLQRTMKFWDIAVSSSEMNRLTA